MQPSRATPEALLEHLDWVRQLARSLVADPNAADDLVQEAWVSATKRPPHAGNLRGWLAQVVRNAARDRRRREARRTLHEERAAQREATPSGVEIADRVALQQQLVQCVLQLEEPYRETVLLRYFQELAPTDIAERTGVPVATVKTRLRRALAELRTTLDRRSGGDGRAWMAALLPLAHAPASLSTAGTGALLIMSTKSIALVATALAVTGLGIFLWVRGASGPEDTLVAGSNTAATAHAALATPAADSAPTALTIDETSATRVATPTSGVRVIVVERTSGAPVPGAEVWHREMTEWLGWSDLGADREEFARSAGARLTADERGVVLLPSIERYVAIVARSGESYGETVLSWKNESSARLEIGPDSTVRVRVVDSAGHAVAGAPVVLRQLTPDSGDGYGHILARSSTQSPDGIATIFHVLQREPELLSDRTWAVVGIEGAFIPPIVADFDPRKPPAEPLQLVLPPTGRVVVLLKSASGRTLPDGSVQLIPILQNAGRFANGLRLETKSRQGRAEFTHVSLDLFVEVHAKPSKEWPFRVVRQVGPRTAGEEVVVTVECDEPFPVLTGRLLDASGRARAKENLSGSIVITRPVGRQLEEDTVHDKTDAEGLFRIPVETDDLLDARCTLHLRTGDTAEGGVLTADVVLPEPLRSGDIPIGDVRLTEPAVVLAGTVRNTSGEPLEGAFVDVGRWLPAEAGQPPRYERIRSQRAFTDKQGRYVVSGVLPPGEYLAEVLRDQHISTGMQPFTLGTRDHNVVLKRWGALEGTLRLPDGVVANRLVVEANLQPSAPRRHDGTGWSGGTVRALPNGAFRIDEIPPGLVDVRVRLDGEEQPLAAVDGVEVPEGRGSTDPRLLPVDLRGLALRQIRIRIEGPQRTRIGAAAVAVRPSGEPKADARRILCEDGELVVVSRWPAIDVEVCAADMRVARREAVTADLTVVMEPGIPFTVRLPAGIELPAAPDSLTVMLSPTAVFWSSFDERLHEEDGARDHQYYWWLSAQAQSFDARRELTFRLPETGPYVVELAAVRNAVSGNRTFAAVGMRNKELDVQESDAQKQIELEVRGEDVAAALGRLH